MDAPQPTKVSKPKSFLCLISYYTQFLPNFADLLALLYKLLQKNQRWYWSTEQDKAYKGAKHLLTTSEVLTHFDSSKPLCIACDASPYRVGAVLSHVVDGDKQQPIAYASRSLSAAEHKYS